MGWLVYPPIVNAQDSDYLASECDTDVVSGAEPGLASSACLSASSSPGRRANQDWIRVERLQVSTIEYVCKPKANKEHSNHPLGHLMQSVFQFHNAERFEIYCYATTSSDQSSYRLKIEADAHHFADVSSWPTQAVVERIASDGIHIRT